MTNQVWYVNLAQVFVSRATQSSKSQKDDRPNPLPSNDLLPNDIKALPDRKFPRDKLTTYGDVIKEKKTGMIQISGFNTKSIKMDEIRSTCQESNNQQIDIQCFEEVCTDTKKSTILQRFLTDTNKSDRASKSV